MYIQPSDKPFAMERNALLDNSLAYYIGQGEYALDRGDGRLYDAKGSTSFVRSSFDLNFPSSIDTFCSLESYAMR